MSEIFLVVRREFLERVRTRAFILGTILFPVFIVAVLVVPHLLDRQASERTLAVIDETPQAIGTVFAGLLLENNATTGGNRYRIQPVSGTFEERREELNRDVQAGALDGYVVFPADLLERNEVVYRASSIASMGVLGDLRRSASRAVQAERLRLAGLEVTDVMTLMAPVEMNEARVTDQGDSGAGAMSTFFASYIISFLVYFMIAFYGVNVMRSVLEEKTNRISEVLMSSMSAVHLMVGKIAGVAAAALLQVGIWAAVILLLATQTGLITDRLGLPEGALASLPVQPATLVLLLIFFLLGFLLYAALFAMLGAAMSTEQEAQSMQMVVLLPLFIPMLFMMSVAGEPLGTTATVLGVLPLTSAIAMPMRMAAASVPAGQVVLAIGLLVASTALVGWIAGKIYRVGMLSTGKRPSMGELLRWVRAA
jgi:ABC-2 type transport system permease protein